MTATIETENGSSMFMAQLELSLNLYLNNILTNNLLYHLLILNDDIWNNNWSFGSFGLTLEFDW